MAAPKGNLVTPGATNPDGAIRSLEVDASDNLKSSVESPPLPTDAATATNQTTMITALQLIDDLRNALVDVGLDELRTYFIGQAADVEVKQQEPADLTPGIHGWDGSDWKKLPMVWGYSDRYHEQVSELNAVVNDTLDTTPVPAGYIHVVTSLSAFNATNAFSRLQVITLTGTSTGPHSIDQTNPTAGTAYNWSGSLVLKEDDYIRAHFDGNTANDDLYLRVWGYKMKIAGARVAVWLRDVVTVLDASELTTDSNRQQIERHDVAECVLETLKPIAFDISSEIAQTGRFVIIDNYEIAGGGVVLDRQQSVTNRITDRVEQRSRNWDRSAITTKMRADRYKQGSTLVLICGQAGAGKKELAKALEEDLFNSGRFAYYLGISNSLLGIDADLDEGGDRDEHLRRLGEMSHLFTDAGLILITTISGLDDYELEMLNALNKPNDCRVINVGENHFNKAKVDLQLDDLADMDNALSEIKTLLTAKKYLIEYYL